MNELEKYYNYLKQQGADVPDTFESFNSTLSDNKARENYYNYLKDNNFDAPDTFESFNSTLFGLTDQEKDNSLKKKDQPQFSNSNSQSQLGNGNSNLNSGSTTLSQNFEIPEVSPEVQELVNEYFKAGLLTDSQGKKIEKELKDQSEGNFSFIDTAKAAVRGYFQFGIGIPVFNFDNKEDLVDKKELKNKIEFIENLSDRDKALLLEAVGDAGYNLKKKIDVTFIENIDLEQKAKQIGESLSQYNELSPQDLNSLPEEEKELIKEDYQRLLDIQEQYNDNIDTIEYNEETLNDFHTEVDLLKRNYKGLDNFIGNTVLSTRSILAGLGEVGLSIGEFLVPGDAESPKRESLEEFQRQIQRDRGNLRPPIEVGDIESAEDFGEWLSDLVANQLPIITTLAATGGTTGGLILGASSAGQKSLELKEENKNGANYSDLDIFLASTGNGTLEFLSERVTGGIISKGNRVIKSAIKGNKRPEVFKGVGETFKSFVADASSEGLSEGAAQLGQNAIDRYYLGKEEVNLFDGVENAIASGGVLGGLLNATPTIAGAALATYQSSEQKTKLKENLNKLKNIQENLNEENIDPDIQSELEIQGRKLIKENKKVFEETIENAESKSPEDLKEVSKLDKQIKSIEKKAAKVVNNPDINENVREDISTRILKQLQNKQSKKEELLDPKRRTNTRLTETKQEGKETVKKTNSETTVSEEQVQETKDTKKITKVQESDLPSVEEIGQNSSYNIADNVETNIESVEFPDGSVGYKVQFTRNGEVIEDKNKETEFEFFEEDKGELIKFLDKKSRGFTLAKNPKKQITKKEPTEQVRTEDQNISFNFLGSPETGVLKPDGQIIGSDGTIYNSNSSTVSEINQVFNQNIRENRNEPSSKLDNYKGRVNNLKQVLSELKVDNKIIDAISNHTKFLIDPNLGSSNKGDVAGYFSYGNHVSKQQQVVISEAVADTKYGEQALIHEAVHAATVFVLDSALENRGTPRSRLDQKTLRAVADLNKLYKEYSDYINPKVSRDNVLYGFNSVQEFVSEFISNSDFREFIERKSPKTKINSNQPLKNKNFAQRLWDSILNLLGLGSQGKKRILQIEKNIDQILKAQKEIQETVGNNRIFDRGDGTFIVFSTYRPSGKTSSNNLRRLLSGFPILTYIDEQVFEKLIANPIESYATKSIKKGLDSRNKIVRNISEGYVSWFNGVARTNEEIGKKLNFKGRQEAAYQRGAQLTNELQKLINYDVESNERVHQVMDAELYENPITYDQLTTEEKKLHDILREVNDATHELNYKEGFIDEDTYNKFKDKYIGRGYEVYEDVASKEKTFGQTVSKIVDDLYKQRKEVDQWKIDNKISDPIYLTVNRLIQTERNVAVKNYADYIANESGLTKDNDQKGYTQLNGKGYGALNGKYIPNYIAEDFKGYFFSNSFMDGLYDIATIYDRTAARQFLKRVHTVYAPNVQLGNFLSNHAFAFASGVNIVELYANLKSAQESLSNKDSDYTLLLENGIIGANVLTPDLKLTKDVEDKLKLNKKTGVLKKIKQLDKFARKVYAGSDNIMKVAAYKALVNSGMTQEQAIQRVFEGFQNYATVGKIWDLASKFPVIGNAYIKFQADLMRIVKNAILKRPLTTASFLTSLNLLALITSRLSEESEEEREIREARPFIPKIETPIHNIPLVMRVGNKEINVARFISPYYDYDIPNRNWVEKLSRFTPLEVVIDDSKELGQSNVRIETPDVLLGALWAAFVSNKDFRQKSITDPYATRYKESGLTTDEKLLNRLEYVSRSVVPLFSTGQDAYLSILYGEDFYGRSKTIEDIVISKFAKLQTWDDKALKKTIKSQLSSINYRQKEINSKMKSIERKLKKDLQSRKDELDAGTITKKQFDRKVELLVENAKERLSDHLKDLVKEQEKMNKLVLDIQGMNLSSN